ncbi:hypothetical protein [Mycoplasma sp. 1654_15]|uniref:hypothetical protein n=1 Tax=Mycoplasma sp. 1654_15 TaxID=2725994 RepID=UPI001448EB9E|nr:hypothetical protein [Mycoplasma sp. 1654_15]QJB71300.1 hypothetical protein HF996_02295 [Mycoplasma sp. 1654_15]
MKFKFINKKRNPQDDEKIQNESTWENNVFDDIKLDEPQIPQDNQQKQNNDLYQQNLDFLLQNEAELEETEHQDEDFSIEPPENLVNSSDEEEDKWFNQELEQQVTKEIEWDEHQKALNLFEEQQHEDQLNSNPEDFLFEDNSFNTKNEPTSEKEVKTETKKENWLARIFSKTPFNKSKKKKVELETNDSLSKEEQEFLSEMSKINSIEHLEDVDSKKDYKEKLVAWSANFKLLNSDIINNLEKSEKNPSAKNESGDNLWDKMSFLSKSIYKTLAILFVSLFWFLFWTVYGGFQNYRVENYVIYIVILSLVLLFVLLGIYINTIKNKGDYSRLVSYYIWNSIFTFINLLIRILFIFTPLFINAFIQVPRFPSEDALKLIGKLEVSTFAPSFCLVIIAIFYIPVNWNRTFKKVINSTGIIVLITHLYLLKNYKNNPNKIVYTRLRDSWIRLNKVFEKPLGIGYHPAFIKMTQDFKTQNLTFEQKRTKIEQVKKIIEDDLK